jgi:Ubiquitin family
MKNLDGQIIELTCNPADTVLSLKKKYEISTGISITREDWGEVTRLRIKNVAIEEDEEPLSKYPISDGCTIYVVKHGEKAEDTKKIEIPLSSHLGFWLVGRHPKKMVTATTLAGTGSGYLALHENMGLLSLAVGAGAGLFLALVVGGLIRCAIPQGDWRVMQRTEETREPLL